MTSYDTIYTTFLNKTKVSDIDLPTSDERIFDIIHGAILDFNNRMHDDLGYDDTLEQVDRELSNDELLILAHFIRLTVLKNQLTYFTSVWQPFQREISLKHYGTQLKSLEYLIESEEKKIEEIIRNQEDDYL